MHALTPRNAHRLVIVCGALAVGSSADAQNESLLRGLVSGCIDGQVRLLGREPGAEEKRRILHFCYCKAPNMVPLVSDVETARKLQLGDAAVTAAVKKIDAACLDGVNRGRLFAPGLSR